jgi:O-acetyl-ADP-ribose deacetylase (regulator of RNase III)
MLRRIEGNILDVKQGIICHFCNEEGIMGAGLAAQIKLRFPEAYTVYKEDARCLGSFTSAQVSPNLYVVNMVTQDLKGKGTQYPAVMQALHQLSQNRSEYLKMFPNSSEAATQVYFPEFVGCGLGKGNPDAIQAMIEHFFPDTILVRYTLLKALS